MQGNLVWFRNDLRLSDNPALYHACQQNQAVIAIYIATPEQWQRHDDASVKIDFWRRNLQQIQHDLAQLNITLHYFQVNDYQKIPKLIETICKQWQILNLFFNHDYPVNEQQRDNNVIERCQQLNVNCHVYHDQLLLTPKSVTTKTGKPFKVFTPFSKQARQQIGSELQLYPRPQKQQLILTKTLNEQCGLDQLDWPTISTKLKQFWPAGESEAQTRLSKFCQNKIADYQHNRDIPSSRATSKLSAYLASGVISARQCWQATVQYCEQNDGVRTWQNELLWREFYKHVLIDYPQVSKHKPWKADTDAIPWRHDMTELQAWQQGQTGFPLVDAAMRQLLEVGWMHNRLRMVTAMFLTKHLLIDWRLGEQWFMQHLIDGDLAANNGGWQWSASTGTDAVPYFRLFNPVTQSQRFDPKGDFIRHYLPELSSLSDKDIHQPRAEQRSVYCQPIVDLKFGRERALAAFKQR
ncbi:MAG: deoxyribodipyrimidine photo-lyase [Gammaproteobacteria bacterium]|nr:deoxyribodipyrimidine photo-lyase [Gammaproteobacteria bacterium]